MNTTSLNNQKYNNLGRTNSRSSKHVHPRHIEGVNDCEVVNALLCVYKDKGGA